jgi:hypothetical protein
MKPDAGFHAVFPIDSFLIEPGPRPGVIRDPETGVAFVPLWTMRERFDAFVEDFDFDGPIAGLQIENWLQLTDFLGRFRNPAVQQVAIDPEAMPGRSLDLRRIESILGHIDIRKPR